MPLLSSKMARSIFENICVTAVHPFILKKVAHVSSNYFHNGQYIVC
jgi:hypothetical protein